MKSIRERLLDAFSFITKKQTGYLLITIKKNCEEGCNCKDCIQKWVDADPHYGRNEAFEFSLPEGYSILFIDKNRMETSKIDV